MAKRVLLCMNHMSGRELDFIHEAFDDNWVVPLGPCVDGFEEDIANYLGEDVKVAALVSGTAALHCALTALGVAAGDEVICQTFTFCASCNPIKYLGATPVFVDSERETWNMDPHLLESAIRDRIEKTGRKPKAIVMVHLYGMPSKVDEIGAVASRYGIPVIEDAAEAFGSEYCGRKCGTFGHFGALSFNGNKMITTSGGGALICHNVDDRQRVMFYATQARESYPYYQHEEIGYNYRMSNICAAIGRGQMTILEQHIAHHRHLAALYDELLRDVDGIELHKNPQSSSAQCVFNSNYWLNTITIDPKIRVKGQARAYSRAVEGAVGGAAGVTRASATLHTQCEPNPNVEAMRLALDREGIESRPLWKPMHRQPVFADAPAYINGVSDELFKIGLCLPSGPCVTDDDARAIVDIIKANILTDAS